jgi:hypothetical protein
MPALTMVEPKRNVGTMHYRVALAYAKSRLSAALSGKTELRNADCGKTSSETRWTRGGRTNRITKVHRSSVKDASPSGSINSADLA